MKTENQTVVSLAADIASLEGDAQELSDSLSQIHAQIEQKKALIRAELGYPQKDVPAGDLRVDWIPPNRRFDEASFQVKYPAKTNGHMYKTVPAHTVIAKDMIPPALKNQFMVPGTGEGTVKIR